MVETAVLGRLSDSEMDKIVKHRNIELIEEVLSRGKGALFLSAHYGNWEYMAYSAALRAKFSLLIVVKPQANKYFDKIINSYRTRSGNRVVSTKEAARKVIRALRNGEAVALLADQSARPREDIFAEFFGRLAPTYDAPARWALKFKVPAIVGFIRREKDGTHEAFYEELKYDDLEGDPDAVEKFTRRYLERLEKEISERPELWVWQHRRWKHKPR